MDEKNIDRSREQATAVFSRGFNCAQAVLSALGPSLGLPREICFKIATPFGAGIARRQEICGAVTGALLALGLAYGRGEGDNDFQKEQTMLVAEDLFDRFHKLHGTHQCRDLLGVDLSTAEGQEAFISDNLLEVKCARFVADAVTMVLHIMDKKK